MTGATSGPRTTTIPEHLSSPPVFSEVRVTRSLVLYVCFVDRCLSFCPFSFGHGVVCSSSICGFLLPLWYLQTLLKQLWSTIPPISTQWTINSHLKSLNIKKATTNDIGTKKKRGYVLIIKFY